MNLTVAMRVIGGFAITCVLLLVLGASTYTVLNRISGSTQSVIDVSVPALENSSKLQQQFLMMSKTTLLDYYATDEATTQASVAAFNEQATAFEADLKLLRQVVAKTPSLSSKIPNVSDTFDAFKATSYELFDSKKRTLELADEVIAQLEETEFAADDAATFLLDFIDLNAVSGSSDIAQTVSTVESAMVSVISAITDIAKENKKQNVETIIKELGFTINRINESMDSFNSKIAGKDYEGVDDITDQIATVRELLNSPNSVQNTKLAWLDQIARTDTLLAETNTKIDEGLAQLDSLQAAVKSELNESTTNVTDNVGTGIFTLVTVVLVSLLASIGIAINTVLKVTRPLAEVNRILNVVATGDLTTSLDDSGKDEFGELARNCNKLIESLRELINGIVNRSNQLATASEQTSMVVKESTVAINDQRSQVEQAATATTEMSSTSSAVMERANEALSDIKHADEEAERVKQISDTNKQTIISLAGEIEQASGVINEVNHHSAAIGGILDVIRGIAEQTNLLALNAAIEAARAGEQGRGFAVVADEVRSLASKTQESTQEIQNMIEQLQRGSKSAVTVMTNSKHQAELCVEQTEQAAIALNGITDSVHQANDMSEQIVTAANEQYQVSSEISERLESIVAIAEQTAAGAEQTDQSSQEVARLAEELRQSVDQFRL